MIPISIFFAFFYAVISGLFFLALSRTSGGLPKDDSASPKILGFSELKQVRRTRFNNIYYAQHSDSKQSLIVKVARDSMDKRLEKESKALKDLSGPNIPSLHYWGKTKEGLTYLALDYVPGPTLEEVVQVSGPLPDGRVIQIILEICNALATIHGRGFAHMDIKPSNVILEPEGDGGGESPVLIDFGSTKKIQKKAIPNAKTVTASPAFAAPEALQQPGLSDLSCDIYSLGCLGYYLTSGYLPFPGATSIEVAWKQIHTQPTPLSKQLDMASYSGELVAVIESCMRKGVNERPTSISEIRDALTRIPANVAWTPTRIRDWWKENAPKLDTAR